MLRSVDGVLWDENASNRAFLRCLGELRPLAGGLIRRACEEHARELAIPEGNWRRLTGNIYAWAGVDGAVEIYEV